MLNFLDLYYNSLPVSENVARLWFFFCPALSCDGHDNAVHQKNPQGINDDDDVDDDVDDGDKEFIL